MLFGKIYRLEGKRLRTAGVICEYNPFHLGHAKQFAQLRAALGGETAIVCAMSGNYVQRGEAAIFDKMVRAAAAVECGANLVVELPVTGVLRSAEGFARCGVDVLEALGVETLAFGCEDGQTDDFVALAKATAAPEYEYALQTALAAGTTYAAARETAAQALGWNAALMKKPNNILGLEYCRALSGRRMRPLALRREGDYHAAQADAENPSATAVRALLISGGDWQNYVPEQVRALYAAAPRFSMPAGQRAMLARLRGMTREDWEQTAHGSEGLWSLAWRAAQCCGALQEFEVMVKSRRYPMTRVRRLLLCAYLGISEQRLQQPIPYVRLLAMDGVGRKIVRTARELGSLPIVNAGQMPPDADYFALEQRAAGLYGLFCEGETLLPPMQLRKERIWLKQGGI